MDLEFSLTCDDPGKKYDVQVGGVSLTTVILYVRELFGIRRQPHLRRDHRRACCGQRRQERGRQEVRDAAAHH